MKLTLVETVAFAGIALYIGAGVRRLIPVLSRYNIPAPVIGGLLVATALTAARSAGYTPLSFDTTLQSPLPWGCSCRIRSEFILSSVCSRAP